MEKAKLPDLRELPGGTTFILDELSDGASLEMIDASLAANAKQNASPAQLQIDLLLKSIRHGTKPHVTLGVVNGPNGLAYREIPADPKIWIRFLLDDIQGNPRTQKSISYSDLEDYVLLRGIYKPKEVDAEGIALEDVANLDAIKKRRPGIHQDRGRLTVTFAKSGSAHPVADRAEAMYLYRLGSSFDCPLQPTISPAIPLVTPPGTLTFSQPSSKQTGSYAGFFFGGTEESDKGPIARLSAGSKTQTFSTQFYKTSLLQFSPTWLIASSQPALQLNLPLFVVSSFGYNVDSDFEVDNAFEQAVDAANKGKRIVLVGWSRGAIRALKVAQKLAERKIEVEYLGLIDPVDTGAFGFNYVIPDNVHRVFHSYKKPDFNKQGMLIFENAELKYTTKNGSTNHITSFPFAGFHSSRTQSDSSDTIVFDSKFNNIPKANLIDDAKRHGIPLKLSPPTR